MLRVGVPGQNKLSQLGVFERVALDTKNLNICRVCTKCRGRAVRFNMVPLQSIFVSACFTVPTLCNNICNSFSTSVRSVANAALPFWVPFFSHTTSSRSSQTRDTTIFPSATAPLTNLKLLATFFTGTLQQCLVFFSTHLVRTLFGASMRSATNVRIWSSKCFLTGSAYQRGVPAPLNYSLELCHG